MHRFGADGSLSILGDTPFLLRHQRRALPILIGIASLDFV